jgi:hypothetical protein
LGDNFHFIISTTKDNELCSESFYRSLKNDENEKNPPKKGKRREAAASLFTCSGMSGGPVLKCTLLARGEKKCQFLGTLWGAERVFARSGEIENFGAFINLPPLPISE